MFSILFSLIKIRITVTVALITMIGWYIGNRNFGDLRLFGWVILSTVLVCAGVCTLNHVLEWQSDSKMNRTKRRPIPSNKVSPIQAILLGVALCSLGLFLMWKWISLGMVVGAMTTAMLYLLVYTPLKRITWLNTSVGAIPGALPIMGGWYAATGDLGLESWLLLAILFFWQHPHFYAIAWLCKEDYRLGGYKMLVADDDDGKTTFLHSLIHNGFLILSSFTILFTDFSAGWIYLLGMIIINAWFTFKIGQAYQEASHQNAQKVVSGSIIYLTVLFILVFIDNQFRFTVI